MKDNNQDPIFIAGIIGQSVSYLNKCRNGEFRITCIGEIKNPEAYHTEQETDDMVFIVDKQTMESIWTLLADLECPFMPF